MDRLIALTILILIHLFGNQSRVLGWVWHGRFLSLASGVSFGYVFVDLLPTLSDSQPVLKESFHGVMPFLDKHAYLIALIGMLFYYGLQGSSKGSWQCKFSISMAGYSLFNFFVGASLADPLDPSIQPIWLFTIAVGLHYFVHDHNLSQDHPESYEMQARWILVAALLLGWLTGYFIDIPETLIALVVAFVAGGMIMNAMRYELPAKEGDSYRYFILGALGYAFLLVGLGEP
jgi:hypothetical protein